MDRIHTYPHEEVLEWTPEDILKGRRNSGEITTVIIPTMDEGTEKYRDIVKNTIKETSYLVDSAAVNEVILMDGSGKMDRPDREFGKMMINWAIESSSDFRNQIKYLKSSRNERDLAKKFGLRLRYKIFNQKNPEYFETVMEHIGQRVGKYRDFKKEDLQKGKGSAVRFSIPASNGDILCCIDSDIKTCENYYCTGLLNPFFQEPETLVTKASYMRKNTKEEMGGRIKRLVYDPFAYAVTKKGKFRGIETLDYGTAGEFAFRRVIANKLRFPNDFGLETSFNTQIYHHTHGNTNRVKQSDLGVFMHSSTDTEEDRNTGTDPAMESMSRDIAREWTMASLDTGLDLTEEEFYDAYLSEVDNSIENSVLKMKSSEIARMANIKYCGKDLDMKRLENYKPHIKKGIKDGTCIYEKSIQENSGIVGESPSWREVKEKIGDKNYRKFKEDLSIITGTYTIGLLEDLKII